MYLVSGMPRSGSRLLLNILAQNPRFYPGVPSGLLETLVRARNSWEAIPEHQSISWEVATARKKAVLQGVLNTYWSNTENQVIFDFNRAWLGHLELFQTISDTQMKALVCVRDLREILASFEMLWRSNTGLRQMHQEQDHYIEMQDISGRCKTWMLPNEVIGIAYRRIQDALARGHGPNMHWVRYEELTETPEQTVNGIYEFLKEPPFRHDFDNVAQVTQESDRIHNIADLHKIRSMVSPQKQKRHILGQVADKYAWAYPWNTT